MRAALAFGFALLASLMLAGGATAAPIVTLNRGNLAEPGTLDPQKFFTTYESEILRDLFCGLLQLDAKAEVIPGTAKSWDVSDDGLTLTFHLRDDAKWSDGVPVTADDFLLGFQRAFNPKTAAPYANFGYVIRNAEKVIKGEATPDQLGVRVIDRLTLEITLERPSQTLLWLLGAYPVFFPVPKHIYDQAGENWAQPGNMVSNGAFYLKDWVPNDKVVLFKNEQFFDAAAVKLDIVTYFPTDDDAAAVKRFRAGELDLNLRFPPGQYEMLKRELPAETKTDPASWIGYIAINQTQERFKDVRVRRALSLAIDRETIVKRVLNNGELPAWSLVPPGTRNFTTSGAADYSALPMAERQKQAKALLAEAGYGPGNPLTFTFKHRIGEANKRAALAISDMWKAVGIDARLEANEVAVHYDRLRQQQFDVADGGWSAPPDAEYFFYLARTDSTEMNFGRWSNAEFDRLSDLGNRERDLTKRAEYYRQAEKILGDEVGVMPVYIPVERALVQQWVKGFEMGSLNFHPSRWLSVER
ncbi:Periplasmic oligopeptide-binding protein [Alphaproteobacteria bacterium SO-S41]|nr:Periplasmic oligopeptide-binding protein [Alphaproteobacteria bacterium SO-S41]